MDWNRLADSRTINPIHEMKTSARKQLDPVTARRVLDADLANLLKRVQAGQPLTGQQRALIEAHAKGRVAPPEQQRHYARNQSELAKALGVSRQLIQFHNRKAQAPRPCQDGRCDVAAWRDYLTAAGKLPTLLALSQGGTTATPRDGRPRTRLDYGDGVEGLLLRTGSHLPRMMQVALLDAGIKSTPEQRDRLAMTMFLMVAAQADRLCTTWGFPSVFEPDENGEGPYPPAIREAASRIAA
ncbi:MAG: hypothetical protein GX450_01025 [Verrucomicrobia bacterium]|nr:hypothetical protein [Verrucomicrobiota bacterium]